MPTPKTICCSKCLIEMSIRQFVEHRAQVGRPCNGVPCPVCGGPVGAHAEVSHGQAVCSRICERNHRVRGIPHDAIREIDDQLAAMRRAEALPPAYQRRSRAG